MQFDYKYYFGVLKDWYIRHILMNRAKLLTFAIFLLISIAFWFLNVLNNQFTANIYYPVRFSNLPENKTLFQDAPESFTLKVKAHGFHLLGYQMSTVVTPLVIDLSDFEIDQALENSDIFILSTKQLLNTFSEQLSTDITLLEITPEQLILDFSPVDGKKVPVKAKVVYEISNQFLVKRIRTEPDSVLVTGLPQILDTLQFVSTEDLSIGKIEKSISREGLLRSNPALKMNASEVKVFIEIEEYTEAVIKVPVEVTQVPDSLRLAIYPKEVDVHYRVALSDFGKIKPYQFRIVAPYSSYDHEINPNNKLRLILKKYPNSVYSPTIKPIQIDYILEKNE